MCVACDVRCGVVECRWSVGEDAESDDTWGKAFGTVFRVGACC